MLQFIPWLMLGRMTFALPNPPPSHGYFPPPTTEQRAQFLCFQLETVSNLGFRDTVFSPGESEYIPAVNFNWSGTAHQNASCIIQPTEAWQVQALVRSLSAQNVPFAIRSGGHSPLKDAASIQHGILVDLSRFNEVELHEGKNLVTVGSGLSWNEVYLELEKYGLSAVGGRVTGVGVGGFLQGTGLSYLTDMHGLGCDNIAAFEVVLADGRLTTASAFQNRDLWKALKGGGNNFGIVTKFTIYTYPIGRIWGGVKIFAIDQLSKVINATLEYQNVHQKDLAANLILQFSPTTDAFGVILTLVYLKPVVNPSAFNMFYSIPTISDTTQIRSGMAELIAGQFVPPIPRWDWFSINFKPTAALYTKVLNILATSPERTTILGLAGGVMAIELQPINSNVIKRGAELGGNALGIEKVNQTWFKVDVGWSNPADDQKAHGAGASISAKLVQAAQEEGQFLPWLFPNDASHSQPVFASYGVENLKFLRSVKKRYDAHGVFDRLLPGGFKIPQG